MSLERTFTICHVRNQRHVRPAGSWGKEVSEALRISYLATVRVAVSKTKTVANICVRDTRMRRRCSHLLYTCRSTFLALHNQWQQQQLQQLQRQYLKQQRQCMTPTVEIWRRMESRVLHWMHSTSARIPMSLPTCYPIKNAGNTAECARLLQMFPLFQWWCHQPAHVKTRSRTGLRALNWTCLTSARAAPV